MNLPKAIRMRGKRRVVALAALIVLGLAATAVAATVGPGDGTLVGSPQNDSITTKGGDDAIYGEGGSDTINIGGNNGNNFVDGDGMCTNGNMQPLPPGVYPRPLGTGDCEDGNQDGQGQMDTVSEHASSMGNDTVLGGAAGNTVTLGNGNDKFYAPSPQSGNNTITMGGGNDTVDGGPNNDTITLGNGDETVYLGSGRNTVTVGSGISTIHAAQSGDTNVDTITCGSRNTKVYANKQDIVSSKCQRINSAGDARATKHRARAKTHSRTHKAHKQRHTR